MPEILKDDAGVAASPPGHSPEGGAAISGASPPKPSVPNAAFSNALANQTAQLLLLELGSGKATTRSLGVLYGMLMGAARTADDWAGSFAPLNRAIIEYFGDGPLGRLDRIKKEAWDFHDRAASAMSAGTAETQSGSGLQPASAARKAGDAQ
jgi:hypothetical protein